MAEGFVFGFDRGVVERSSRTHVECTPSLRVGCALNTSWHDLAANYAGSTNPLEKVEFSSDLIIRHVIVPRLSIAYNSNGDASDLVPGKYLGGLKIWSCARDLASFMSSCSGEENGERHLSATCIIRLRHSSVLELGCGHGIGGITALLLGAGRVTFHDFNEEVLNAVTKPNVAVNYCGSTDQAVPFAFGDWVAFYPEERFDLIIGSDVCYDPEATEKFCETVCRLLNDTGMALIATKNYYFGTNGGAAEILQCMQQVEPPWDVNVVWQSPHGAELSRCILSLKRCVRN